MNTRCELRPLLGFSDHRGLLVVGEAGAQLPFTPARLFVITQAPADAIRGQHAHRRCHQVVIALSGSCRAVLNDGAGRDELTLDSALEGLYVPPLLWLELSAFAPGTVVLVLASEPYDADDYIRSLPEFLQIVSSR